MFLDSGQIFRKYSHLQDLETLFQVYPKHGFEKFFHIHRMSTPLVYKLGVSSRNTKLEGIGSTFLLSILQIRAQTCGEQPKFSWFFLNIQILNKMSCSIFFLIPLFIFFRKKKTFGLKSNFFFSSLQKNNKRKKKRKRNKIL